MAGEFSKKGVLQSVEAVLAVSIILIAAAVFLNAQRSYDGSQITSDGYAALEFMDDSGILRNFAMKNDTDSIKASLKEALNYDMDVYVCANCDASPDADGVSAPEARRSTFLDRIGGRLAGTDVYVVEYYISGQHNEYSPRKVVVAMWR